MPEECSDFLVSMIDIPMREHNPPYAVCGMLDEIRDSQAIINIISDVCENEEMFGHYFFALKVKFASNDSSRSGLL